MVTKKDLQQLEMSLDEYFEYIVESKANGQHEQAKMLFTMMSQAQSKTFFEYVDSAAGSDSGGSCLDHF